MHDVMKHLNMSIALPAKRLQRGHTYGGVNIYIIILPFHGLREQSTANIAKCIFAMSAVYYITKC